MIEQCTFELVSFDKGSFIVNFELPNQHQVELLPNLGETALTSFINVMSGLAGKEETIYEEIKDKITVQKVLRTLQDVLPSSDEYNLQNNKMPFY